MRMLGFEHRFLFGISALLLAASAVALPVGTRAAEEASLAGSWSGAGRVTFPSGATEPARCKASFRKRGGNEFGMTAVCATSSARIEQTAAVSRNGPNRFSGGFNNAEYGISGSINITLRGDSLTASLVGGGGSATFSMSR